MKRIIIILITCLLFSSINVYASSFNTFLNVDKNMVTKGEKVTFELSLSGLPSYGLSSGNYYVNYDSNYYSFSCDNIIYGQNVISSEIDCNIVNGKIILIYVDSDGRDTPLGNGVALSLPFEVINDSSDSISTSFILTGEGFGGVSTNGIETLEFNSTVTTNVTIEREIDNDVSINDEETNFEGDKIEGTVDSPETGIYSSIIIFTILLILGYLIYTYNIKKNRFPKV